MYIRAAASISHQASFGQILQQPVAINGNRVQCIEPDYGTVIDARMIRRMSRIIKMGVAVAKDCLVKAGVGMPEVITTGTAYGCLEDTEVFLKKMVENNETLLTPTAFIQSTHNTVGAQIALLLQCQNYNNTFVHGGFSFETALMDAIGYMQEKSLQTGLVGGLDELTDTSFTLLKRFGLYKPEGVYDLYNSETKGTIAGEGASFFLLSTDANNNNLAELKAVHTLYKPSSHNEVVDWIAKSLQSEGMVAGDVGTVLFGENGDKKEDEVYHFAQQQFFSGVESVRFKHLCGEYPTASAFGLWYASNLVQQSKKTTVIYNHYLNTYHSLYVLSVC